MREIRSRQSSIAEMSQSLRRMLPAVVASMLVGTTGLHVGVPPASADAVVTRRAAVFGAVTTFGTLLPAMADEVKLSPAKAKILAAKQAAAEKAAAGGYAPPETNALSLGINLDFSGGADVDPFKEANELRDKIIDLESQGKLSKSKSAQLNQYKTMEMQARDKANATVRREQEKAQEKAKRETEKAADDGSFTSKLSKVTGVGF